MLFGKMSHCPLSNYVGQISFSNQRKRQTLLVYAPMLQIVPKCQHHHRTVTSVKHEVHAVQSQRPLRAAAVQTRKGTIFISALLANL